VFVSFFDALIVLLLGSHAYSCRDARVMWDHATGRSKGYGFVSFRSKEDAEAAIDRMQGRQIGSRRIRVGWAQHKQDETSNPLEFDAVDRADPSNTNVYIGNVSPETTEADVRTHFSVYGPLAEVKVHKKGGYGFVKFEQHRSAVQAIVGSHGRELHGRVSLSSRLLTT
jgi:nucleolysin TIA-1/TIAR